MCGEFLPIFLFIGRRSPPRLGCSSPAQLLGPEEETTAVKQMPVRVGDMDPIGRLPGKRFECGITSGRAIVFLLFDVGSF
jgi:hypothetical protein